MLHFAATATAWAAMITTTELSMAEQTLAEHALATLIVQCLNLDTVPADQIDPDAPLFGGDLGLDSIDALEIALAVSKNYGFQLRSDNPDNRDIFTSLRTLSAHIEQHRVAA
jgi:acyl carrier protein